MSVLDFIDDKYHCSARNLKLELKSFPSKLKLLFNFTMFYKLLTFWFKERKSHLSLAILENNSSSPCKQH